MDHTQTGGEKKEITPTIMTKGGGEKVSLSGSRWDILGGLPEIMRERRAPDVGRKGRKLSSWKIC